MISGLSADAQAGGAKALKRLETTCRAAAPVSKAVIIKSPWFVPGKMRSCIWFGHYIIHVLDRRHVPCVA
jgi:hypothetical protein